MGGREHYSYRNRTRRILLLPFKESFFFLTSNKLLNKCLKCLKRLEVLLGTFRESTGTLQWPHSTCGFFSEAVPLIRARFSLLCIKGTCGRENISKIFSNAVERDTFRRIVFHPALMGRKVGSLGHDLWCKRNGAASTSGSPTNREQPQCAAGNNSCQSSLVDRQLGSMLILNAGPSQPSVGQRRSKIGKEQTAGSEPFVRRRTD